MVNAKGESLMQFLLTDPEAFDDADEGYELVDLFLNREFPLERLRPLLSHENILVRRFGSFVTSELGISGYPFIDDMVPLINDEDGHTQWNAIESVFLCATDERTKYFACFLRALEDSDKALRKLAMRLTCKAEASQVIAGLQDKEFLGPFALVHKKGLAILENINLIKTEEINCMIEDQCPLTRRYAAIASQYLATKFPELLLGLKTHEDDDIREFAEDACEELKL